MGRLFFSMIAVALAATGAFATEPARIFPGFEKVYKDSKKKEAEAFRAIDAAQAEIAASTQLRLDGERQIADADSAIRSQQLAYLTLTRGFGAAATAREARVEAAQLEAAARTWADAEGLREKGLKTVLAAEAQRTRAIDRLAAAQTKLGEAQTAIARTLQDGAVADASPQSASIAESLVPRLVEAQSLPPPPKAEASLPAPASAEPRSALDAILLGGPDRY